ncbi:MAG: Gfo/Idh/MocA family protein [Planctomycetota bacterium]
MVRLAIVGIGGYGWELVEQIQRASDKLDCQLAAAADARFAEHEQRAEALRQDGVALYHDALEMFDALQGRCDAVYIATGIPEHADLTIAALEAGYHVHLEKPPAATVQETDAMQAAVERTGRFCLVGFQAVHSTDIRLIKERAVAGRFGEVQSLACYAGWPRDRAYYARNGWAGQLKVGDAWTLDGPAANALSHQIVNMLLLASPEPGRLATPTAVRAELYAAGPVPSHDTAAIEVQTAEGPTVWLLVSHCTDRNFGPAIVLQGSGGRALWRMRHGAILSYDGETEQCPRDPHSGRPQMVANFVQAVADGDGSALRCPLAESRKFVLVLDGAHESSGRIHRIAGTHFRRTAEDTEGARTAVDDLDELLVECAEQRCLFSDLDAPPPWAVGTEPFSLAGYDRFPQRFAAE